MRRSTEKAPEWLRIKAETWGCLIPRILPASHTHISKPRDVGHPAEVRSERVRGVRKQRLFWRIFAVAQLVGVLGVATGGPHGFALGLIIASVALFPGSILCVLLLDFLGVNFGYGSLLVTSFLINLVCWYAVELAMTKIRGKKPE
jgi:hypothetical protein